MYHSPHIISRSLPSLVLGMFLGVAAACGGGDDDATATSTAPVSAATASTVPSPGSTTTPTSAGTATQLSDATATLPPVDETSVFLRGSMEAIIRALQSGDRDTLRTVLGVDLRASVTDAQLQSLTGCIPSGATLTIVSQTPNVVQDATPKRIATVTATLRMSAPGLADQQADIAWNFVEDAGPQTPSWGLSVLPECPFPAD